VRAGASAANATEDVQSATARALVMSFILTDVARDVSELVVKERETDRSWCFEVEVTIGDVERRLCSRSVLEEELFDDEM